LRRAAEVPSGRSHQRARWHEEGQYDTERIRAHRARCHPLMTKGRPQRRLVVVARDEDRIHAKLRRVFAADAPVSVIFDRRANASRNPPWLTRSLRIHGFAVVPAMGRGRERSRSVAAG
jgi:hypothetical protein